MEKQYKNLSEYEAKDIAGYEGLYAVTKCGKIYSHSRTEAINGSYRLRKGRWLKFDTIKGGYLRANLYKDGIRKRKLVHVIVAEQFIPNPDNKPCVNHVDNDRTNNHVSNLEWCTHQENIDHAVKQGRTEHGTDRYNSILNDQKALEIFNSTNTHRSLAEQYGVSNYLIWAIKSKTRWKHIHKGDS
ncbi:TPA: NUMOD4 motif-containing HNH endonuclease [Vibrio parahaemolyticus]|nr:NUMOD4 motif-containing HNH endonuclease [Vibrio parahaemolyticus]